MNNIRKYRKDRQKTLTEIAEQVGISISYLCHLEKGTRKNPSLDVIERIAITLNVRIDDLYYY